MSATSQGTLECPTVRGSDTSLILIAELLPPFWFYYDVTWVK